MRLILWLVELLSMSAMDQASTTTDHASAGDARPTASPAPVPDEASSPPSWAALTASAGPPEARAFSSRRRLFGAATPEILFWRDNSAWCPYCLKLWLLLELMRVPYEMRTIPLQRYLRPGETKNPAFLALQPSGVVPVLQVIEPRRRDGESHTRPATKQNNKRWMWEGGGGRGQD